MHNPNIQQITFSSTIAVGKYYVVEKVRQILIRNEFSTFNNKNRETQESLPNTVPQILNDGRNVVTLTICTYI